MFSRHYDDGNRVIFLQEANTKNIHYRNYKTFNANLFKQELNNELLSIDNNNAELVEFTNTVLSLLDKHAPIKRKYIRANNAFMTKELRAAIIQKSKLDKNSKKRELTTLNISTIGKETFVSAFWEKR